MPPKKKETKTIASKKISKKKALVKKKKVIKKKKGIKPKERKSTLNKAENIAKEGGVADIKMPELVQDLENNLVEIKENNAKNEDAGKNIDLKSNNEENIKRPINMYRKIAISFIALTLLLLSVVVYFTLISVEIILIPNEERISDNIIVDIYDKEKHESISGNSIFGIIEQIELKTEKEYSSTGIKILGEEVVGKVTIINNYNKNQPLVATTRLLTNDNKLFRIKDTVNVPAGGKIEVDVYADKPDASMAIDISKFTIPGLWSGLQDKIYAESKEKFIYEKKIKKYIQQSDIDKGVDDLKKALIDKAKKQFGESYKSYDKVMFEVDDNSIKINVSDKVGEEKNKFKIDISSMVALIAFSEESVNKLAEKKLIAIIPDNKKLKELTDDKITYSLNSFNVKQGVATINSSFESLMTLGNNAEIIEKQKIIGLSKDQLRDYLSSFREIESYKINFSPSFVDKVPNLIDRIDIKIER